MLVVLRNEDRVALEAIAIRSLLAIVSPFLQKLVGRGVVMDCEEQIGALGAANEARLGFNTVRISTRVDGQITKVFFTEGQEVKAGDPLFEIDPRPFRAALDQAAAAKERAWVICR